MLFKIVMKFQNPGDSDCCDILEFVCLSNCLCHVDVTVLKATAHGLDFGQLFISNLHVKTFRSVEISIFCGHIN